MLRNRREAPPAPPPAVVADPVNLEAERLRGEADPDAMIEAAAERLRLALQSLDAIDEWGRRLAWRQVARIALGPLLTELRDAQTALRLASAVPPSRSSAESATGWPSR